MSYVRRVGSLLAGAGLLFAAGFGPLAIPPSPPMSEPAKLGFSSLSQAQMQDLWRRADNYALAEAFLKQCGAPSFVERRMFMAARDCIEARALNRVAAYFRKKVAQFSGRARVPVRHGAVEGSREIHARQDRSRRGGSAIDVQVLLFC